LASYAQSNERIADGAGESTTTKKKEKQMNEQDKTAIIGAIELEIDGYLDGAPDANEASKLANHISGIIHNGLPLPYALPKGSMTPRTDASELAALHVSGMAVTPSSFARELEIETGELKDALKNLRDYCSAQGWDISTSNRVAEPANEIL
jgi:hypothetical protein